MVLVCIFCIHPVVAQENSPDDPVLQSPATDPEYISHVVIDGDELFVVRGSSALPASERAELVQTRILSVAEASVASTVEMHIRDGDLGKTILADGILITVVTTADAEYDQMDFEVVAAHQAQAIEQAIIAYRKDRSDGARVGGVVETLIWSALFIVGSFLLLQLRNRLPNRIAKWIETRTMDVQVATNDMVRGPAIAALVNYALRMLILLSFVVFLYYYLSLVLLSFAETKPLAQLLITYITDPILGVLYGFIAYFPNLVAIAVIAGLTNFIIKGFRLFFKNVEIGTIRLKNFEATWIWPTFNIIRVVLVLIAIVISFPYIPGSDSAAFQGLTILVGVMISLGSNSVIANALAGIFVIYRRSTNIGDRIKVGKHIGDVVEIKLMETYLKSIKNELVSIPNSQLLNSEVVNYSTSIDRRGLLVHTTVGIGYEEPQEKIEAMLIEAASRTNGLKKTPVPFVLLTSLADYAINYQVNAHTSKGSLLPKIESDLHRNIVNVFNENKVQIMTPSYIADPDTPKLPTSKWGGVLASLDSTK